MAQTHCPIRASLISAALFSLAALPVYAQSTVTADANMALRVSQDPNLTVEMLTDDPYGMGARTSADLAAVMDDGSRLRVLPVAGRGAMQNVADLLYLKGIDIAIVQSDVLSYVRRQHLMPSESTIQYIAKLYPEEVHVLARDDIKALGDLAGQSVCIGLHGSGSAITAAALMHSLDIAAKLSYADEPEALEQLRQGKVAAVILVAAKPAPLLASLGDNEGLHLLPVPLTKPLVETYLPTSLSAQDYPGLVDGKPVDTVAISAVMVTLSASPDSPRAHRVSRFVTTFFSRFDRLLEPGRAPKWREVSLGAQLPGWVRFPEAQALAQRQTAAHQATLQHSFDAYLTQTGSAGALDGTQKAALFRDFLRWREDKASP